LDAEPVMKMRFSCGSAAAIVVMSLLAVTSVAAAQQPSLPSRPMLITSDAMTGFVTEASQRFGVPDAWIRSVMQVESDGDTNSTSSAGAMGLMQVMPQTYAMLRARLGLGANPYDPRDNIMAGAAYLREMHDRYGSAGFLAAYNAGPGRFEEFRAGVRPLPAETVHYLARLNPMLGIEGPTMLADANLAVTHVPATSPIFVRLPPPSGATGLQSSGQQNMQVAAADLPTDLQTGSLFAARSFATFPSRSPVQTAPQSQSDAPSNTMFIQRRASRAAP
jgi:hypothetical protein